MSRRVAEIVVISRAAPTVSQALTRARQRRGTKEYLAAYSSFVFMRNSALRCSRAPGSSNLIPRSIILGSSSKKALGAHSV